MSHNKPAKESGPGPGDRNKGGSSLNPLLRSLPLLASFCLVAAAAALSLVSIPAADDYCRAAIQTKDLISTLSHDYMAWTGRWAELVFDISLFPLHEFHQFYPVFLIGLLTLYLLSIFWLVSSVTSRTAPLKIRAAISTILLSLFIAGMPTIGETLFWVSGSVSSALPVFGIGCILAFLISPPACLKPLRFPFVIVCCLVVSGLHEVFALVLCLALLVGVITTISTRDSNRSLWIAAFVAAAVGAAVVVFAPGNRARSDVAFTATNATPLGQILASGAQHFFTEVLFNWVLDLKLWAVTVLVLFHPRFQHCCPTWRNNALVKWAFLLSGLVAISFPLFLPQIAAGHEFQLPGRTMDGLYAVFLLAWLSNLFVFTRRTGIVRKSSVPGYVSAVAGAIFAAALLLTSSSRTMLEDLRSSAIQYKNSAMHRMDLVRDARRANRLDLVLPGLTPVPRSYSSADITADTTDWVNVCTANYLGFKTVSLEMPGHLPFSEEIITPPSAGETLRKIHILPNRSIPGAFIGLIFAGPVDIPKGVAGQAGPVLTAVGTSEPLPASFSVTPLLKSDGRLTAAIPNTLGVGVMPPATLSTGQELVIPIRSKADARTLQVFLIRERR